MRSLRAKGKRIPIKYPTMEQKRSSIRIVVLLGILPFLNGCAAIRPHIVRGRCRSGHRYIRWLYTRRIRVPNLHGAFASGGKRNADGPESDGYKDQGDCDD